MFNDAEFFSDSDLPGKLFDNNDRSFMSFFRLVGCLYYKQATSENKEITTTMALYNAIRGDHLQMSHMEYHIEYPESVELVKTIFFPTPQLSCTIWKMTVLVFILYMSCLKNTISLPLFNLYGFKIANNQLIPIWDSEEHIPVVEDTRKHYLKGCGCKTRCTRNQCGYKKSGQSCSPGCR